VPKRFVHIASLLICAFALCSCSSVSTIGVTCTFGKGDFNCGINKTSTQDLPAQGAKDEKPVGPFKESLQRSEKIPS
jgi:hypothetical protein